jgi:hypothetical protein
VSVVGRRWRTAAVVLLLVLGPLITFAPSVRNDFVRWDDHVNLLENPHYRGLGWPQLRWMFTTFLLGHYMPVTWLSFGIDYRLWGMNPAGYHLTSLLLHVANTVLFYGVARRLLAKVAAFPAGALDVGALVAALFFSLHPLRAESVAWATERRDVLSGLFFLLTILTYLEAADAERRPRRWWLTASVGFYALALGAKAIVMTLPAILTLLDLYPLRRLGGDVRRWAAPGTRSVWAEKLPYWALALGTAVVAWTAHRTVMPPVDYPWPFRLAVTVHGLWFYVAKTLVPIRLSPLYEFAVGPAVPASVLGVTAITVILLVLRARWPAGLAVGVYYAATLAPVGGIVYPGTLVADRYMYLPGLGFALLVGGGAASLACAWRSGAAGPRAVRLGAGLLAAWLFVLATLTWRQVQIWRDTETFWRHAIAAYPDCATCHGSLGSWLVQHGSPSAGLPHLERAVALSPDRVWLHINIGGVLDDLGRPGEALAHYREVLDRCDQPGTRCPREAAAAHVNIGLGLRRLGRDDDAAAHFRRAVELEPGLAHRIPVPPAPDGSGSSSRRP